jgi:rhodanese-related sulfurtransferase
MSRRLAAELLAEGYKNVKRYQLGIPVWRALNGVTEVELEGIAYAVERGSILIDARGPEEFMASSIPGARNLPLGDVKEAGKDGRLPVEDHNARIIIFGRDGEQARAVCKALTKSAFHNTSFYGGTFETLSAEFK